MNPMNAELLKIVMQMRKLDWTSPDGIVWLVSNTFFEPVIAQYPNIRDSYLETLRQHSLSPMDFKTISEKCSEGSYGNVEEFLEDIQLIAKCCEAFNKNTAPNLVLFATFMLEEAQNMVNKSGLQ